MNFIRAFFKNIVALLIGCLVALLIVEGILQVYNPFDFRLKGNKIVLPANQKYVMKRKGYNSRSHTLSGKFDDVIVHTKNSLGFRGAEPPDDFNNYLTIITIGGSTTECTYLADGKTWTDRLETYLKNDYRNIWINNAGLDGHSTFGHTVLIEDFIIQLKPDIALLLIGANEGIEDFGKYDKEVMKDKIMFHSLKGFVKSMANHSEVISIVVNLYRYVQATLIGINHREINFSALTKSIHRKSTKAEEKAWEENIHKSTMHLLKGFKNRLENLIDILKKNNITPILITQPTLYGDFTYDIDGSRYSHGKDLHYTLELYNDVTRSVCKDNDLLVIDLAAELPKNTRYYYDFYHYTNEGAKKVADIIYMKLYPYLVQHRW